MARDVSSPDGVDSQGMNANVLALPDQVRTSAVAEVPAGIPRDATHVLFCGMGGSAIAGALVTALAATSSKVPVGLVRHYDVPAWCGEGTVAVAVSYSGNTEETLSAASQVLERGGRLVAMTSGGSLGDLAAAHGMPVMALPGGLPPRAAFGYLFGAASRCSAALGILPEPHLGPRAELLEEFLGLHGPTPTGAPSPWVSRIADHVGDEMPLILAPDGVLGVVGYRWVCQINENAKRPARMARLPEANHNDVVSWDGRWPAPVILLDDGDERSEVRTRIHVTGEIIRDGGGRVLNVSVDPGDRLDRALSLCALGDALSLELAYRSSVDPTPIPQINRLKKALADARRG